ncbi:MAG: phosphate ABC transporter permease PstA [Rhodospirillales bacterium]|nr:MAG: phosphate ABC transporter permease PstA [Rhodospirillales bacterium]
MRDWFKSGAPWIWLNAGAAAISLIMVFGLIALIAVRGLSHFWPSPILETTVHHTDGTEERVLGELRNTEVVPVAVVAAMGIDFPEDQELVTRYLIQLGNRDLTGRDFAWFVGDLMDEWQFPDDALVLERTEWGNFYGYLLRVKEGDQVVGEGEAAWEELFPRVARAGDLRRQIHRIERFDIGAINTQMERIRLDERSLRARGETDPAAFERLRERRAELDQQYAVLEAERAELYERIARDFLVAESMDGREVTIPIANVVRAARPNTMSFFEKLGHYFDKFGEFVGGFPREANTEGGIFPAIFGTVMMVLLMSVVVTPLGVLAAIYLREYAKQGPFVQTIRISVNNLAGVPSIVFGVFGLGFFVYWVGGSIDDLFYPERLPAPTFGTPGLMWASLTLALLTLPVVIVATEEGLTRIPRSVREGSLALGATKAETLWRVIVPMAAPAMMTGLILAVARAAGEVAPLMLVGVVKLAPNLPVDGNFPFLHLERKFMHLGFHIYDVGFQSPNVEAARPLVYATALMLVFIIIVLNLTAIAIRNRLREKAKAVAE